MREPLMPPVYRLSDVNAAVTSASDGDTVVIPSGSATWTTGLSTSKGITLQGAGIDVTTITDGVQKDPGLGNTVLMTFAPGSGKSLRVTGFSIYGSTQDTSNYNKGTLDVFGTSHSVRVDNVKFYHPGTGAMIVDGDIWGVIDHCYFDDSNFKVGIQIHSENWAGGTYGDGSFQTATNLGSGQGLYIEDNTFIGNGVAGVGVTDATEGGRFVFRYNNVTSDNAGTHGTEGQPYRGVRSFEYYNNTFTNPGSIIFCGILIRGGTGVIWGNTFTGGAGQTGYKNAVNINDYRIIGSQYGPPWGHCNGSNPWDGNTDGTGYPAIDQPGMGICSDTMDRAGDGTPTNHRTGTQAWPTQAHEPIYYWSNNWTPVPNNPGAAISGDAVDVVGRDAINNGTTAKPGYTPYVYPHPLTGGSPTPTPTPPAPPQHLRVLPP